MYSIQQLGIKQYNCLFQDQTNTRRVLFFESQLRSLLEMVMKHELGKIFYDTKTDSFLAIGPRNDEKEKDLKDDFHKASRVWSLWMILRQFEMVWVVVFDQSNEEKQAKEWIRNCSSQNPSIIKLIKNNIRLLFGFGPNFANLFTKDNLLKLQQVQSNSMKQGGSTVSEQDQENRIMASKKLLPFWL